MKRILFSCLCCAVTVCLAFGQNPRPKGYTTVRPVTVHADPNSLLQVAPAPLPMWTYNVVAAAGLGGASYSGTIIGRSPRDHGKTTTTVPTQIIPLVITINDGTTTVVYDPTVTDTCAPGHTDVDIVTGSPIFTNTTAWTMSTVNVGTTQYIDAFQRAEFWTLVGGTPYHTKLNQTTLGSQALSFQPTGGAGQGTNYAASSFGGCATGHVGVVNIDNLDAAVSALITGPLAGMVNIGTFPIFLTKNVVAALSGHDIFNNCCVLGYHSGISVGSNLQIYSPFSLDTSGVFGGDVETLSHEMGEAINDPDTSNPTPHWGNIGQVQGGCQNNFEVGDPLSEGFGTPTTPFTVSANGLTYHMQELAYFSWFYGGTSLGAGGKYSNNNSFSGFAKLCPPGGTN